MGEGRLAHLDVGLTDLSNQPTDVVDDDPERRLDVARGRFSGRHLEAAVERLERGEEPAEVHRRRPPDPDRRYQRREVADDLELRGLVVRNQEQHRVDLRHARERAEGGVLAPELVERVRAGEGRESRAARRRQDALLPVDGLGSEGLEVEQVVVELDVAQAPRGHGRQGEGHEHDRLRVGHQPLDERHVDTLERQRPRNRPGRPARVTPVDEDEHCREHRDHREPRQQEGGAGDESELAHPAEVGEPQDVEGAGGRHRAQQHARAASPGRDLDRLPQIAAEEQLLLVAEEEVDAVVDADADHDRDEHDREQRKVSDHQGGDPDRPAEAHGEDRQHQERLADAQERHQQEAEREGERDDRGPSAVAEGRHHLVVLERRLAGHADRDVGEFAPERGDHVANAFDGVPVAGEAPALRLRLGQDEEQALVLGQEVARARMVAPVHREEGSERRPVRPRPIEPHRHLGDQILDEPQIGGALAVGEPEVDEVRHERGRDLGAHALDQLVERRPRRERLHELLVVEDLLADRAQLLLR